MKTYRPQFLFGSYLTLYFTIILFILPIFLVMVSNNTFDLKIAAILAEGRGEGDLTSVIYVSGEEVTFLIV